jgi:hypothetical protein
VSSFTIIGHHVGGEKEKEKTTNHNIATKKGRQSKQKWPDFISSSSVPTEKTRSKPKSSHTRLERFVSSPTHFIRSLNLSRFIRFDYTCTMFTATQMMFILGKAAVLALSFPTFLVGTQLMKTFQQSLPHEIANSAFDSGLYMAFQEPYRSYPCMPQKVHISQANNVENDRVSMTVSFTLNRDLCEHVKPTVIYGRGIFPEGEVVAVAEKLDFSFTSNETSGLYMSDWIYHMELPDLWAGLEKYWYRIQIDLDEEAARLSSSSSSSSDSLLRWFFLRGRQGRLGETPAYTFRTAPRIGSPTTIALIGDLGHAVNSTRTMNHILSATQTQLYPVSTFLIAGDLAYADGDMLGWEYWLNIMVCNSRWLSRRCIRTLCFFSHLEAEC